MSTTMRTWFGVLAAAGLILFSQGCGEPSVVAPDAVSARDDALLYSSAGLPVSVNEMTSSLTELTRGVALALGNPHLRSLVYQQIQASLFPENKLHFRSFLTGSGREVLHALAAVSQSSADAVLLQLDSLLDLEFYMPVEAHRRAWDGGSNLIVASVLLDDGTVPTAFDLSGRRVLLASAETPPATPTLAVVPVETDFSSSPAPKAPTARPDLSSASMSSLPGGVWMTAATIYDEHEGWLMGDPEFEMHVFAPELQGGVPVFTDVSCAGHEQGTPQNYDQNDVNWTGEVRVAPLPPVDTTTYIIQMWEDDFDACRPDHGRPPYTDIDMLGRMGEAALVLYYLDYVVEGEELWAVAAAVGVGNALGPSDQPQPRRLGLASRSSLVGRRIRDQRSSRSSISTPSQKEP